MKDMGQGRARIRNWPASSSRSAQHCSGRVQDSLGRERQIVHFGTTAAQSVAEDADDGRRPVDRAALAHILHAEISDILSVLSVPPQKSVIVSLRRTEAQPAWADMPNSSCG